MTIQNNKTKMKSKTINNNTTRMNNVKKNEKGKYILERKKINSKLLLVITFFTGVLLIISSYAWFSMSLNVKIKFIDLVVTTDNGLFISLDGINFSDSVEISADSIITNLKSTYPNHTNQWSTSGLWPVSSNGIKNSNSDKFDIFVGEVTRFKNRKNEKRYLNTRLFKEDEPSESNVYVAFDIFLKNVSGSPLPDNLYLDKNTFIDFADETPEDIKTAMSGIMNSMRFGFVRIGSVPLKADVNSIQNMKCNNSCEVVIYEPNSTSHSATSIEKANECGITLIDGIYYPSYATIKEGTNLDHTSGQAGSGIELDTEHFTLQKAITNLDKPIFKIPNSITKLRVYVWIEGQDIDSLETNSKGAAIVIGIDFIKDLAGYQ